MDCFGRFASRTAMTVGFQFNFQTADSDRTQYRSLIARRAKSLASLHDDGQHKLLMQWSCTA
jgi:hypothetical protein